MIVINYPEPAFRTRSQDGKAMIFDAFRKKWLSLTPEEWVRQNFLQYLVQRMNYPSGLIAIEKTILLGELRKRFDIVVFNRQHEPWMMIECKASTIPITEDVLIQVLRYHAASPAAYLVVTNGHSCYASSTVNGKLEPLDSLPEFPPQ